MELEYTKLANRNYVEFRDVLEMRDIVTKSNQEGYYTRVVAWEFDLSSEETKGIVEFWK